VVRSRPTPLEKRLNRLEKRVQREVYIFPDKHDPSLNRLVKRARRPRQKSLKRQMDEWREFKEKTE
jgi:hypothetical protein